MKIVDHFVSETRKVLIVEYLYHQLLEFLVLKTRDWCGHDRKNQYI